MKKGLRFIIAFFTLASIGTWFLPAAEVMGEKISIADVLVKAGIGYFDRSGIDAQMYGFLQTYLGFYVWFIAGAAGLVLIEAVLIAVLRKRAAYITALIISVINIGAFLGLFFLFRMKLGEVEAVLGGLVKISYIVLAAWTAVYALNVILAIIGIILWRTPGETDSEEIYLEQINRAEAERARRRQAQEQKNIQPDMPRQGQQVYNAQPPIGAPQTTDGQKEAQEPSAWAPPAGGFFGAISGESGLYSGKVYRLRDKKEVFFIMEGESAVLTPYEEEGAAAGIYYVSEYGEYCAEPLEKNMVFLDSGQPLGKGRQYFLPRGTKICIGSRANSFILV